MSTASDLQSHARTRHEHGTRRVVRHGRASTTLSIAQAVVIKQDELFFLCDKTGDVPINASHGLGLYYHDCRYLNGYEFRIGGLPADQLAANASGGAWATFEMTNPDLKTPSGELLEKEQLGVKWERTLNSTARALTDAIAFTNFSIRTVEVPVAILFSARFESIFDVRGAEPERRGTLHRPRWTDGRLVFVYDGADHVRRCLAIGFDPQPASTSEGEASFHLTVAPRQTVTIHLSLCVSERKRGEPEQSRAVPSSPEHPRRQHQRASDGWVAGATTMQSDSDRLNAVLDRSIRDLHLLQTTLHDRRYFAAGVPWYVTLFGRDSIVSAIESLAFLPDNAEDTVCLLASYQGTTHNDWRDEEPGKIMHELRVGEMARLHEIPQTPYYGSVDATPLFLILLAEHARWTGRLDLFTGVMPHVDAALRWIDDAMAQSGTGYLTYATKSTQGLANQGWKDSGDSIVNRDGTLATPPIALVEVQAYVYYAKLGIADLYRRAGDAATAERLRQEADALRNRFEQNFWLEELDTYALALQRDNRPAAVVSSNPGHALWSGIAAPSRAKKVAARLMRDDMFSGWGIRTLSADERRYNPIGYHDGTVWPHDNALAVAGFARYGCGPDAARIVGGMIDAASSFDHDRLPEVFAGFSRSEFATPVHYPVACHPQAWAAGAVPFMLASLLGLEPDAFHARLQIREPVLPASVRRITVRRLRVGSANVSVTFARAAHDRVLVDDVRVDGVLDVIVATPDREAPKGAT